MSTTVNATVFVDPGVGIEVQRAPFEDTLAWYVFIGPPSSGVVLHMANRQLVTQLRDAITAALDAAPEEP